MVSHLISEKLQIMNKVFVVTSGSYSDYRIDAIFTTRELAQSFIDDFKAHDWRQMDIEEWDLDPNKTHLKQNRKPYFLRINKKGDVTDLEVADSAYGFEQDIPDAEISYTPNLEWMNIYCFAADDDHAVKIAGEKRSQILAANIWGVSNVPMFKY
jgi:hypothetical protein